MSSSQKPAKPVKDKKQKLNEALNKALNALKNPDNSDELYVLVKLLTKDNAQYVVSLGRCAGGRRPFPCIVIDNGVRQVSFSVAQVDTLTKVISAMSEDSYNTLIEFITNASSVRPIRRREVKDTDNVESESNTESTEDAEGA